MKKDIYLDGAANTPVDPEVYKSMKPFMKNYKGNSHAIHSYGIKSMEIIEECRNNMSNYLGVKSDEIYFTSGATEGNNWIILSLAFHAIETNSERKRIICSAIEHSSVLNTCKWLSKLGFEVIFVNPNKNGKILIKDINKLITFQTLLVCVMAVNNETGVSNNIDYMSKTAHHYGAVLLGDCTQSLTYGGGFVQLGKIYPNVDYMTFSSHKIYGPTGVGCLICRKSAPLFPLLFGGSQESGLRGGTHNLAGIVGMSKALEIIAAHYDGDHYNKLYNYLLEQIEKINNEIGSNIKLLTIPNHKNIVNLDINCSKKYTQIASDLALNGIACSASSACDADIQGENSPKLSHVLLAMQVPTEEIGNCVRLSFNKYTKLNDIKKFILVLKDIIKE